MTPIEKLKVAQIGDKVRFEEEKQAYTIQARDTRYLICSKPFNPRKTVLYCIVDLEEGVRGPENLVFGAGAENKEQCEEMICRLNGIGLDFKTEVSYRRRLPLNVKEVLLK